MTIRPAVLLLPILGIALGFLLPFEAARPGVKKGKGPAAVRVGGVWSNQRFLENGLVDACDAAEQVTGKRFVERPTIRVSDAVAVADVLRADMHDAFMALGAKDDAGVAAMCKQLAAQLVSVYDPNENVIHIVPAHAVRAAEVAQDESLKSKAVLTLLLYRMGIIAIDRQTYPEWKAAIDKAPTPDAVYAAGAVLEGHAQYQTERIAEATDMLNAFAQLVSLLTTAAPEAEGPLADEAHFAIVKGHAFMKKLAFSRGRGGIIKHLKEPPLDRTPILDPGKYFARPAPTTRAPKRSLKEFHALLGEGWEKAEEERSRDQAQALLEGVKPAHLATVMAGFENGQALVATHADHGSRLNATVLQFRAEGLAEGFVNLLKSVSRGEGRFEDGAGRDSGLPGFVIVRKTDAGEELTQWTFERRYVIGLVSNDADIDREQQDDALEAATEAVRIASTRRRRGR